MPIYHDGKKMKPYRGYRKPVNIYYGDKKVAGWKNSTQTGNNLTFQTTYNDTADVEVKGNTAQQSEWMNKTGLSSQARFSAGDEITVPYRGYSLIFRVVDLKDEILTLEMKHVFGSESAYKGLQYDAPEAFYFAEEGLAAGTYNFTLLAGYDTTYGGGKTYQFTLAQDVPAGGCLMFPWGNKVQADTVMISSYASLTATTAIESDSVIEGSGGTSLGVADGTGNMNHTHRIRYGSDNYAQSALRQWLNSSAALGSVWTPKTKFDRPPTWHTSADAAHAGFMNGLDSDFLSVVETAVIPCRTNSIHEVSSLDGDTYTINTVYNLRDKFFTLSRPEIYGTWDSTTYKDGELLDFYNGLTDVERKKFDVFGTVRYAWLRSPHPDNAYGERFVNISGSVGGNFAAGSMGVAAACKVTSQNLKKIIDDNVVTYSPATTPNYTMPSPDRVSSIVSNLPAGTYYTTDYKGDKYEFTLTVPLGKIGTPTDSIEFDKYSHGGYIRRGLGHIASYVDETIETDYMSTTGGLDVGAEIYYVLETATRAPLTFTLNNASTAPECPMTFLTSTPSLEYPAGVYDASGTVTASNSDESETATATIETLRSNADGTVYDEQNVTTGDVIRRMNPWANITGANTLTKADSTLLAYKVFKMSLGDLPIPATATTNITAQKYDSTLLTAVNTSPTAADKIYTDGSYFYISAGMADTGFSPAIVPTDNEIKAYCFGHNLCHSDGRTPFYKSEIPYNPTTWAEWVLVSGDSTTTMDSTGLTMTAVNGTFVRIERQSLAFKVSTKYGVIYDVVSSNLTGNYGIATSGGLTASDVNFSKTVGKNKTVFTTYSTISANNFRLFVNLSETTGNSIKLKDIRIYELPAGSQIETDFETLTADQLNEKYPFDGLNVKHWKHLVGTDAEIAASITPTLPTASYDGFTPYKMIYELAEPVEEQYAPVTLPTYYPTTVIEAVNDTPAEMQIAATVKVEDE